MSHPTRSEPLERNLLAVHVPCWEEGQMIRNIQTGGLSERHDEQHWTEASLAVHVALLGPGRKKDR